MSTELHREITRRVECRKVDLFLDLGRHLASLFRVERETHLEENVLQAHQPKADVSPAIVGARSRGDSVIIKIDDAIELTNSKLHIAAKLIEIKSVGRNVPGRVDRAQVANSGLVITRHLDD